MKKILFVGAEALPFAATGGLGDVLGSLPAAIKAQDPDNLDVRVIMPLYSQITEEWRAQMKTETETSVWLSWRNIYCGVKSLSYKNVTYYFIDNEQYFKRDKLYGHFDDGERYAFFCEAVLAIMPALDFFPDVLHAHDWQAALSVIYLRQKYRFDSRYAGIRTIFTIHNIEYQGKYDPAILNDVFGLSIADESILLYDDCLNLMKGAIECANIVSTVSPKYAEEIKTPEYSHGLFHELCRNSYKLRGILNGIDYDYYNPQKDSAIAVNYSWRSPGKKIENKLELQRSMLLPERADAPLICLISRLVSHKGLDLFTSIAKKLLEDDIQIVVLGMGDKIYEDFLRGLEYNYRDKVRSLILYNRDTSKKIYASADIFLMPSKSEPCGLSQMIASRYGAIPVVRETGGLYDSIKGYWEHDGQILGNGFTFYNYSADELYERTCAAIGLWRDAEKRQRFVTKIMKTDFSWSISGKKYIDMYNELY